MPEIKQYENQAGLTARLDPDAQVRGPSAQIRAAQMNADALEGFGGIAQKLGKEWEDHRAQEEISQGFALEAELNQNISTAWNNNLKNADPNDPQVAQRFQQEDLEPILQAYQTGFQTERGKAWAEARIAALRSHYFEKTVGDQARLAGVAVVTNLEKTRNAMEATLQQDPSQLPLLLSTADSMVGAVLASNPNWTPEQIANFRGEILPKLRNGFVMAAGGAQAQSNPKAFKAALEGGWGGTDIDADQRRQLWGAADRFESAADADRKAAEAEAKRVRKEAGNAFLVGVYAKGYNPQTGTWSVPRGAQTEITQFVLQNPDAFDPGEVSSFINALQRATEQELSGENIRTDPALFEDFRGKVAKGTLTKQEVDNAYYAKRLSKDDWRDYRSSAKGGDGSSEDGSIPGWGRANERINEFLSGTRSSITKSNPMAMEVYPLQDQRNMEFGQMVRRTILDGIKNRGMSADEAVEKWLSPDSKSYLGNLIPFYQLTPDQLEAEESREGNVSRLPPVDLGGIAAQGAAARAARAAPAARKPGETPAEYLRRTGGG